MPETLSIPTHTRFDPLTGTTVLVSPRRMARPWNTDILPPPEPSRINYDPTCYLCPGNERAGGKARNPRYTRTFVYDNDFPALALTERNLSRSVSDDDLRSASATSLPAELIASFEGRVERGVNRVIICTPDHGLSFDTLSPENAVLALQTLQEQYKELGSIAEIGYVTIFQNLIGNSNPHDHFQAWAQEHVPMFAERMLTNLTNYHRVHGRNLLLDQLVMERVQARRIVYENGDWIAYVPYAAVWPYEMRITTTKHRRGLDDLNTGELTTLAECIQIIYSIYRKLFGRIRHTMFFYQRPTDDPAFPNDKNSYPQTQLFIQIEPPQLTPGRDKYMVGYERGGGPQRDFTPEQAAETLRKIYKHCRTHLSLSSV